jgi:hypothetical protein
LNDVGHARLLDFRLGSLLLVYLISFDLVLFNYHLGLRYIDL